MQKSHFSHMVAQILYVLHSMIKNLYLFFKNWDTLGKRIMLIHLFLKPFNSIIGQL